MNEIDFEGAEVLGKVDKSKTTAIYVLEKVFHGRDYVDIRVYYYDAEIDPRPTRKGIMIPKEHIREILRILQSKYSQL